jgi:chitinase
MDQVEQNSKEAQLAQPVALNNNQMQLKSYLERHDAAQSACFLSDCGDKCPSGTNTVIEMSGSQSMVGMSLDGCPEFQYRNLCCADGTMVGNCQ